MLAYQGDIPNAEFAIGVGDKPSAKHQWGLTYDLHSEPDVWLISDHGWFTWPVPLIGEYTQVRKEIAIKEPTWEHKTPQVLWRGVVDLSDIRRKLVNAAEGKEWNNVQGMGWAGHGGAEGGDEKSKGVAMKMSDHCRFQYLAYTEGRRLRFLINYVQTNKNAGASYSGRFKYLHNCNSVIITHRLKWAEWHGALMKFHGPDQNMVQVKRDFSDLEEKMEFLIANPDKAKRIADNNVRTFRDRYMTPAAQACYARRMIKSWASVQAYKPMLWTHKSDGDGEGWVVRGTPYETWMIKPMV